MAESYLYWWLVAIGLGVAELITGTFWMLVAAGGAVAAAVAAMSGAGLAAQLLIGGAVVLAGAVWLRRLRLSGAPPVASSRNPDVLQDIGARLVVPNWNAQRLARVQYRGASWEVELLPGEPTHAGQYVVREVVGNRLLLAADRPATSGVDRAEF